MEIDKLTEQILEITNNSDYGWIDLDSADADRIRVALTQAMDYTRCSTQLKDNEIEFSEFIREFCIKTETFKWLYKGVTYTDIEIDQVYKNYLKTLSL